MSLMPLVIFKFKLLIWFILKIIGTCAACDGTCANCSDTGTSKCTTCPANKFLKKAQTTDTFGIFLSKLEFS